MKPIIYVDVLIIINIYISYGLLLLTCYFRRLAAERLRILLSSLFGGVYSLIILVPDISDIWISLSRVPVLVVMVLLAFGFENLKELFRSVFCFFGVNLVFAGAMLVLWLFFCPASMYYNGGVVYFGIDAFELVILTVIAYVIIRVVTLFAGKGERDCFTYTLKIYYSDKEAVCKALYDSGNSLTDPFSGEGVIIVSTDIIGKIMNCESLDDFEKGIQGTKMRLIPLKSVSGTGLLPSFRADKIDIIGINKKITIVRPVIAVSKEKIFGGEYGALLYSAVFENITKGKVEADVLHI